jgi:hypothetical protein
LQPSQEAVQYFTSNGPCRIFYNHERFQNFNTFNCGHLCLTFLQKKKYIVHQFEKQQFFFNPIAYNMSYYFFFSDQETSELSEDFNPPIILENDGFYEIGLTNFSVNNAIPNVDEKNNKFHYGDKDEVIEIPVGSYEIADINKYLKTILTNKTSKEEKDKIYLHLQANLNTLKCEIKCNKTIDFSKPNSIGQLLGFERRELTRNKLHMSDFPVDIMRVNMIRIECNIATNSYRNGR